MLTRHYDLIRSPMLDLIDVFNSFEDYEKPILRNCSNAIIDDTGIKIELPGVKVSNIDIAVEGKNLKVSGKSRHGKEFSYTYVLKSSVDENKITAKLEDGLLEITLPKKQETSFKKIKVDG
jgi:HSP20 family protein